MDGNTAHGDTGWFFGEEMMPKEFQDAVKNHKTGEIFFVDVTGLAEAWPMGFKNRFEVVFLLSPFERTDRRQKLELGVSAKTFRINSTPIVTSRPFLAPPATDSPAAPPKLLRTSC